MKKDWIYSKGASLVAQMVKHLSVMQQTQVQSLGLEDPLENGMATHSSILDRGALVTERWHQQLQACVL